MNCPSCQAVSPSGAKFCMSCGSALAASCPQCNTELPPDAQFCFSCGHKMGSEASTPAPAPAPAAAPEPEAEAAQARIEQYIPAELLAKLESARTTGGMQGERRIVTMLFCDVEGSTAAAEQLDPEEWAEIMNGAFEHLIAPVYRYEGTLARLMGDAILAFFGAPIGHEDDPRRAVLAGLDIIEGIAPYREEVKKRWGMDFNVRVGINTGLVVVGEVGSDLRVEYTALGDAVNLASRMEQTAEAGTVQITDNTQRLIATLFEFEDIGGIVVKGKAEPVQSYRVVASMDGPSQMRGIVGLDSPLIGRDDEMAVLRGAIDDLGRGSGQIVSVMGEAGLGKSRLVAEMHHSLVAEGFLNGAPSATMDWYEGRCMSYQTATPYAPFIDLLTRYFGLRPDQSGPERFQTVKARTEGLLGEQAVDVTPFLATLLEIELDQDAAERVRYLDPPLIREKVFRAVQQLVAQAASERPLVLVMEDIHWIDPTSLELLEQMLSLAESSPLMVLSIFRPWRNEPSWRLHETADRDYQHRYTSVMLQPLNAPDCRELVANLLHVDDLPPKVRALILLKAEGNPFFVEEVIRSLLDSGLVIRKDDHWVATKDIVNIAVPDTLAGVITARLDRLDDASKRVAQTAAVIGREFDYETLADVYEGGDDIDAVLTDLQRREMVREKSRIPHRVYSFKHALTQETVYSSLLLSARRKIHRRVATCLEQMAPDEVQQIARHYMEAREQALALPFVVASGDRAAHAYATADAIAHYKQALEILETVDDEQMARRAYEGVGGALTFAYDAAGATENYHQMFHVAEKSENLPMQVSALNKLGYVTALFSGQFPEAEKHLLDAERLASECGDAAGLAEMHMTYCYMRTAVGDFEDAEGHLAEAAEIGSDLDMEEPTLFGKTHLANTMIYMTRFDDAWRAIQVAMEATKALGNRKYEADIKALALPMYYMNMGKLDAAVESAREGMEMAAQIGSLASECNGAFSLGLVAWMRGEYESAVSYHERALAAARDAGMPYLQTTALCALGTAWLDISTDYVEKTVEYHQEALKVMEMPLGEVTGAISWADMGFCAAALGDMDQANTMFRRGLDSATAPKHMIRPRLLIGTAFVALSKGDLDEAAANIGEARGLSEAAGMVYFGPLIDIAAGKLHQATGHPEEAVEYFTRAADAAMKMNMRPAVWQSLEGAAEALSSLDRDEEAEAKRNQVRGIIDEIASLFKDDDLRQQYIKGTAGAGVGAAHGAAHT